MLYPENVLPHFYLRAFLRPMRLAALLLLCAGLAPGWAATRRAVDTVPQCPPQIKLTASYLAPEKPGQGPGFYFQLENRTPHPVTLVAPLPSSAHWYAHVGRLWLWRASAGRGGSLVNALSPRGPMFVDRALRPSSQPPDTITIPAHGKHAWAAWTSQDPAIAYQPSCAQCNYPGEHEFRAIFAYAWLPAPGEHIPHLLTCGLRSNQVIMPPFDPPHRAPRK